MYILTQNLKNVLKSKLKVVLSSSIDSFVDNLSDIFDNTISNKYTDFTASLDAIQRNMIINIIQTTFEEFDEEYKKSDERKEKYTINKSYVPRTITTIFGDITYKRTYYYSKFDFSLHFLLDEELGLQKYEKYDYIVKALAINNSFQTNQKKAGEIIGTQPSPFMNLFDKKAIKTIPRQSINNWINQWNVPDFYYPTRETPDTLFIMVDEKYLGCQDLKNDIMVKSFVVFEAVKQISKERRKLINRLVYSTYNSNAWESFVDLLYKQYDADKLKNIYLMSDGGTWIKSGIDELRTNKD